MDLLMMPNGQIVEGPCSKVEVDQSDGYTSCRLCAYKDAGCQWLDDH